MQANSIRALTPLVLAIFGGVIGGMVLVFVPKDNSSSVKWSAGMGLAGTAIAGAAGLAQPSSNKSAGTKEGETKSERPPDNI